jgi:hypothetical protein
MNLEPNTNEAKMDGNDLWREEIFTDRKVGTIRRLTPVKLDGSTDASRKTVFTGEAQIMTPGGALPLNFEIPAETLEQAVAKYGVAVEEAFRETMEELKEMQRRAASSLVIPKGGAAGLAGLGNPPGGGKLHLP